MKKTIVLATLTLPCMACGPTISTSTDWDESFGFSGLSTYAWAVQTTGAETSDLSATVQQQSDLIRRVVEKILRDFPPDG